MPNYNLNYCQLIANQTLRNTFWWNFNWNWKKSVEEKASKNNCCKASAILLRLQELMASIQQGTKRYWVLMVTLFVVLLCRIWMNIKPQQNALKHKLCARFFMLTVNIYDLILDQSYRAYSLYLLMYTTSKIYFHEFWFWKLKGHGHCNYRVNMCYSRIFSKRSNKACFLKDPKFNLHTFDKYI